MYGGSDAIRPYIGPNTALKPSRRTFPLAVPAFYGIARWSLKGRYDGFELRLDHLTAVDDRELRNYR